MSRLDVELRLGRPRGNVRADRVRYDRQPQRSEQEETVEVRYSPTGYVTEVRGTSLALNSSTSDCGWYPIRTWAGFSMHGPYDGYLHVLALEMAAQLAKMKRTVTGSSVVYVEPATGLAIDVVREQLRKFSVSRRDHWIFTRIAEARLNTCLDASRQH